MPAKTTHNFCILNCKYEPKSNENIPIIYTGDILYGISTSVEASDNPNLQQFRKINKLHLEVNYNLYYEDIDNIPLMIKNQPPPAFNILLFKYIFNDYFPPNYYDFIPKFYTENKVSKYSNENNIYFTETMYPQTKTIFNIPGTFNLQPDETIFIMIFPCNSKQYPYEYTINGFLNISFLQNFN